MIHSAVHLYARCNSANAFSAATAFRVIVQDACIARFPCMRRAPGQRYYSSRTRTRPLTWRGKRPTKHQHTNAIHASHGDFAGAAARTKNDPIDGEAAKERFDTYEGLLAETGDRHAEARDRDLSEADTQDRGLRIRTTRRKVTSANGWVPYMMNIVRRSKELQQDAKQDRKALDEAKRWLAYVPLVVDPQASPLEKSVPVPWALRIDERRHLTASQLLDEEIRRFAAHITLTETERKARERVLAHITGKLSSQIKGIRGSRYFVFGSMTTGTALPYSDIDIGVSKKGAHVYGAMYSPLQRLYNDIAAQSDYICAVFRGGKFPIMTAQHADSGVDVQVIAGDENPAKNKLTMEMLDSIPNARPLYAVVRTMLGMRGFIDPFVGGISAYGAMHMLFASLLLQPPASPSGAASPAAQLQHYLSFFAKFDTESHGLAVRPPETFPKTDTTELPSSSTLSSAIKESTTRAKLARASPLQPYLLCLEDPAKSNNDLGARVTAIKHIQATIQALSEDLAESMLQYDVLRQHGKPVEGDYSLLLPLVGRCHEVYAERRTKLVAYEMKMQEQDLIKKLRISKVPKGAIFKVPKDVSFKKFVV